MTHQSSVPMGPPISTSLFSAEHELKLALGINPVLERCARLGGIVSELNALALYEAVLVCIEDCKRKSVSKSIVLSLRSVTLAFSRNSHAMVSSEREELLVWAVLREVFHRVKKKKSEEKRSGLGIPAFY